VVQNVVNCVVNVVKSVVNVWLILQSKIGTASREIFFAGVGG
jgi:hypothetical protein